jgi:MFS family permease
MEESIEKRNTTAGQGLAAKDWSAPAVYSLGFLTVISVFNYLDRAILGLALPLIKSEMAVSDTVLGLVSGLAFVLFYSLLGIPIAWAADRWSRRNIIAAGFAFWSVMTAVTGFVGNIWQLALTRFLMGAGEACGIAPSNSMIADLFRRARRPLALAIFGTANSAAFIILFPIAGWIAQHYGWRAMFVAAGLPGILLALLFFATVREPERGGSEERKVALAPDSFLETVKFLAGSRAYLFMLAGVTFMGANVFGAAAWTPTFLTRVHGLDISEVAASIGPIRGALGALGVILGGVLVDRMGNRDERMRLIIPAVACMLVGPAEALFLLGDPKSLWLLGFALTSFFTLVHQGPIFAAAMAVVKVRARAVATAIIIFCASLLGQAVGPLAVGVLNDALQPEFGGAAVRYSMLIVAVTPVLSGVFFLLAARSFVADSARAAES